jgi:hypothetical protein
MIVKNQLIQILQKTKNQYPTYAVKSDDGHKTRKVQS